MGKEGPLFHMFIEESRLTSTVWNEVCLRAQEEKEKSSRTANQLYHINLNRKAFKCLMQFFVVLSHSSTLAWRIPWTEEPGRLQSVGSGRVRHDWATSLSLFTFMHWRKKWQPNPVFLPGESQGWRSLVGCHLWGRTESDMTEAT